MESFFTVSSISEGQFGGTEDRNGRTGATLKHFLKIVDHVINY